MGGGGGGGGGEVVCSALLFSLHSLIFIRPRYTFVWGGGYNASLSE